MAERWLPWRSCLRLTLSAKPVRLWWSTLHNSAVALRSGAITDLMSSSSSQQDGCCLCWLVAVHRRREEPTTEKKAPNSATKKMGVLAKGVSVESSVTANKTNSMQGIGPSSTFGTQSVTAKRGVHFAETLQKTPFSWFLTNRQKWKVKSGSKRITCIFNLLSGDVTTPLLHTF